MAKTADLKFHSCYSPTPLHYVDQVHNIGLLFVQVQIAELESYVTNEWPQEEMTLATEIDGISNFRHIELQHVALDQSSDGKIINLLVPGAEEWGIKRMVVGIP